MKLLTDPRHRQLSFLSLCFILALLVAAVTAHAQISERPSQPGEGTLMYRTADSGTYETVPLRHTDVALDVQGLVLSATVTQQYTNSATTPIEAVYVFPLPHDAAVYDLEIRIGNRVIHSVIRERAEAKRIYEQAKSEGKRAALLDQERPNIFTTSVANIMPGDQIDVRLRYVEPLRWEAGRVRIDFPMVVGPRYIPGTTAVGHAGTGIAADTDAVPDASRITPPVRAPASRPGHDIALRLDLDPGFTTAAINCISHTIRTSTSKDGRKHVELAPGDTIPNRDFVLELLQDESRTPQTALFLSPTSTTGETHFLLTAYPPTLPPTTRVPMEMVYMIDVSGSMEGTSIIQARQALLNGLDRLAPADKFSILTFSSGYREFSVMPLDATAENISAAKDFVRNLRAEGGTEMLPALEHLLRIAPTPGYLRHIVLLTDGDLGNEDDVFNELHRHLGETRLYTVAIGSAPNLFLATKMAQYGRGTFTHIADNGETRAKMTQLFDAIERPVLTDVHLAFDGVDVGGVYPERLPDLFMQQPLLVYGRISNGHAGSLHITARAGAVPYDVTLPIDTSHAQFHPGITTLWARQRVEDLMDAYRHADEDRQRSIRNEIVAHAMQYHLVTQFTSLVAVEEVAVNAGGQSSTVQVATELPAGWKRDAVFGAPATGTADDFFAALGWSLLLVGFTVWYFVRRKVGKEVGA